MLSRFISIKFQSSAHQKNDKTLSGIILQNFCEHIFSYQYHRKPPTAKFASLPILFLLHKKWRDDIGVA